ncbi:MAG TPA: hypothetical protein VKN99_06315 [Polyangia bacterium]|nr:hypothetical protein [Polyangia bacterium]
MIAAGLVFALLHVGSPDVFYEGPAGPYRLLVTVRPPQVIPGVAEIEIRSPDADVAELRIVPLRMAGPGALYAPTPDQAHRSREDAQLYSGSLWIMEAGAWQVRILAQGARGDGALSVPVPALPARTAGMQRALGGFLFALLVLLGVGLCSIVGASTREAQLEPGAKPTGQRRRRARVGMVLAGAVVVLGVVLGNGWWNAEASDYAEHVYKPLALDARVTPDGRLELALRDPGWLSWRRLDDLVPDHDHLLHLFVIRLPEMERLWHLHPDASGPGRFVETLPTLPAGRYALFADIVHASGLFETAVTEIELGERVGPELSGDDSAGPGPPLAQADFGRTTFPLAAGGRALWHQDGAPLRARRVAWLRFSIEDADGRPAQSLEPYMGMAGHAAVVRRDRAVFAHLHPSGSVPMALLAQVNPQAAHAMHGQGQAQAPSAQIAFPYGFPQPGPYRLFIQWKRAGRIETAVFDAQVMP